MDTTPLLKLPYLLPAQAQKHVTHAEALQILDAVVHLSVDTPAENTPPPDPAGGTRMLVGATPEGAWEGHAGALAVFLDGSWRFHTPQRGWVCHIAGTGEVRVFDGTDWQIPTPAETTDRLGISATPDATNRLALASPASLFNHAGDSHRLTINRAMAGDHASLLFQTGFTADAEIGLAGSDGLVAKIADNGGALLDAWRAAINPVSGEAQLLLGTAQPIDERAPLEVHNQGATAVFNRLAPSGGVMMSFHHLGVQRGKISVGASGNTVIDGLPELTIRADGDDRMHLSPDRVEMEAPLRLDSVSLTGLPDPAVAGSGALVWLASGAPTGVIYSDGTAWRRLSDDTLVP